MNNKKIGNKYENELAEVLQKNGYWCHIFSYNQNGQPCDIVAIKDCKTMLIDVKHCESDRFVFERAEPNQRSCFEYAWKKCGIQNVGFAIYFEKINEWKWLYYKDMLRFEERQKSVGDKILGDIYEIIN